MRRAARRLAESVGVVTRTTRRCASHRATPAWTSSSSAGLPRTAPASDLPIFSSAFAVARHARAYASLRKEVTRDGNVRWVRLAGSGDDSTRSRGGGDARRDSTRSRPPNRTPSDPETNRQRALNARVSKAPDAIAALREFAEAHRAFPNGVNDVNVAALFVALARSTRLRRAATPSRVAATASKDVFERVDEETTLFARAALASLLARLRELAPTATGRVCANVLHALGQLEARDWWTRVAARGGDAGAFEDAAASVARRAAVAEVAHSMNAQELANTYNGVSRLGAFAAASVSHQGWVTLSDALVARIRASEESDDKHDDSRKNVDFAALAAVLALNALASDKTRAAAEATSQDAFDALIRVAARAKRVGEPGARAVDTLSEQGLANVLNACAKLEKARLAVERLDPTGDTRDASRGWRLFTSRVASLAPRAGDQGLSVALHALTLCGDDARASVDEGGWRAFETAALRLAPTASPQAAAMLLNGAWKLAAEPSATRNGFSFGDVVLEALGRRAAEILVEEARFSSSSSSSCASSSSSFDEQATFVAADALGKLPAARAGFSAVAAATTRRRTDPWAALAGRLAAHVVEAGREAGAQPSRPSHSDATASSGGGPAASFHVLARVPELAGALVTKKAWRDVGSAIAKLASGQSFDAEDCARVLNGYAKQRRNALVAEATPPSAPRALARRVAALAADGDVDAMHVATIADALKKLPEARGEFERLARLADTDETGPGPARNGADSRGDELLSKKRNPWDDLARVVAASAADLEPLQVTNVVSALGWLEPLASALARREGGWRAVLAAAGNRAASIKRGANESEAASAPDFSEAPEARKWLEKTSAGLELVRGHAGYQKSYGDEADRERLTALEAEFRDALKRVPS